jgi:hypothetical protein
MLTIVLLCGVVLSNRMATMLTIMTICIGMTTESKLDVSFPVRLA